MISMLRELFQHQVWADAALLEAVREHADAWKDEKLRWTLHHIVMVQRAFLALCKNLPFDFQKEMKIPETMGEVEQMYRDSNQTLLAYVSQLEDAELTRTIEMPWIPGCRPTLGEALLQVVLHSQNHRGQCLTRLRGLGAKAPTLDFILWVKDRPAAAWATV